VAQGVPGGSILLLGPPLQHIPDSHRFDALEVHCYPPYPAQTLLYDDDGTTRAYEQGAFSVTRISVEGDNNHRAQVTIATAEGSFPEQVSARELTVLLHRSPPPAKMSVNGEESNAWTYDRERECTSIPLVCPTGRETTLEIVFAA